MTNNQLISVNPLTRERKVSNFDYGVYQSNAKNLNPYPIIDNSTNRKGDQLNQTPQAMLKLIFSNYMELEVCIEKNNKLPEILDINTYYLTQEEKNKISENFMGVAWVLIQKRGEK